MDKIKNYTELLENNEFETVNNLLKENGDVLLVYTNSETSLKILPTTLRDTFIANIETLFWEMNELLAFKRFESGVLNMDYYNLPALNIYHDQIQGKNYKYVIEFLEKLLAEQFPNAIKISSNNIDTNYLNNY